MPDAEVTEKQQVAFVTGASRGIGKVCAIALAEAGFDIAITARTVQEGEAREHSSTVAASDTSPLPGSPTHRPNSSNSTVGSSANSSCRCGGRSAT